MNNFRNTGGLEGLAAPSFNPSNHPIPYRGRVMSIISYTGGKAALVDQLVPLFEWIGREYGLDTFVTATGGACRVLLNLDRDREIFTHRVYSDVDYSLASLFFVLSDETLTNELIHRLSRLDYTEYVFKAAQDSRRADDQMVKLGKFEKASDYVTAAANMYILAKMSYAANLKSFNWLTAVHNRDKYYQDVLNLHQFNPILSGVTVFRKDCRQLIREVEAEENGYDPKRTIILCDIPYDLKSCLSKKHYDYSWDEQDHINFRELIKDCESKLVICGYQSKLYDDLVERNPERWQRVFLKSKHVSSSASDYHQDEYIYINFKLSPEMYALLESER